ncbi:MAG: DUF3054 domain-containing protein [Lapillicoccus sp.]
MSQTSASQLVTAGEPAGRTLAVAAADAVAVLVFAAVGRASHDESSPVLGVLSTAWPFLAGAAAGWAVAVAVGHETPRTVRRGIPVWVGAVAGGMLLRAATGRGTALSFVIVATVVLAVLLLGWRAVDSAVVRRHARTAG